MGKWGGATGLPDKTTLRRALRGPAGDADPRAGSGPGGLACLPKGRRGSRTASQALCLGVWRAGAQLFCFGLSYKGENPVTLTFMGEGPELEVSYIPERSRVRTFTY